GRGCRETPAGRTVTELIFGARFRGRYETVTSRRRGAEEFGDFFSVARHCIKRAAGLLIASPSGLTAGADQSLQVESGLLVLPLRVCSSIEPSPTHDHLPQVPEGRASPPAD